MTVTEGIKQRRHAILPDGSQLKHDSDFVECLAPAPGVREPRVRINIQQWRAWSDAPHGAWVLFRARSLCNRSAFLVAYPAATNRFDQSNLGVQTQAFQFNK